MIDPTFLQISLPLGELALRVGLAMLFGLLIGWDRGQKNKPIDFRAYMIVAATSCLIAIMGQELSVLMNEGADNITSLDQAKIIEGVMTGIGFLGAGCILKNNDDNKVVGTATGASIWASGGIGLALGYGFYMLALAGFSMVFIILIGGGLFMTKIQDKPDDERAK